MITTLEGIALNVPVRNEIEIKKDFSDLKFFFFQKNYINYESTNQAQKVDIIQKLIQ